MIEINLTDREITDYQLYRFDEYISVICEYLKTHMDDKIKPFPHVYYSCKNDVIPMIRFYPTRSTAHSLKPLGQFVDHIVDQINQYNDEIDKMTFVKKFYTSITRPMYIIPVLLPKIGTHGNEILIYDSRTGNTTISKLINYYESLKQGDDKMIALVYMKALDGEVTSEILPYEVKYYRDDEFSINKRSSIEFIDVFTNKKCIFEFKGDKIMGVNIKDNTSEGAAFEQALAFADKKKHKSIVHPKKVHAHEQVEDTRDCLLYYERLSNIVNCCVFNGNLCKDVTLKTIDVQLFAWLCSLLNMIVLTKNTDVNLELIKNACEHLHSNGNLTDVYDDIIKCIKDIELCR